MVNMRYLQYFIAVAEERNFNRAAKRLNITQPPLTRQIRQLEEQMGVRLLNRGRWGVSLTDAGRVFLGEAKSLIAQAAHAVERARRAQDGKIGLARVGIAWGLGDRVSRVLAEHAKRFPEVEVECRNIASGLQNEALRTRTIDVGFLRPVIDHAHLLSEHIFTERFVVVLPTANPLARCKSLSVKQLAHETLLLIEHHISSTVYDRTLELYRSAKLQPKIIQTRTLPYEEAGAILVASGKGIYIAVGSDPVHPSFMDRLTTVPLKERDAKVDVHVAWHRDERSVAVREFIATSLRVFNSHG
jgi:DNA-binding transcriptional LysR family regulator